MHDLIKTAKKLQEGKEAAERSFALRQKQREEAYAELERRAYLVAFPDYDGPDSYARINADRAALDALDDPYLDSATEAELGRRMRRYD